MANVTEKAKQLRESAIKKQAEYNYTMQTNADTLSKVPALLEELFKDYSSVEGIIDISPLKSLDLERLAHDLDYVSESMDILTKLAEDILKYVSTEFGESS